MGWNNPILRGMNACIGIMLILPGIAGLMLCIYLAVGIITIPVAIVVGAFAGFLVIVGLGFVAAGKTGVSPLKMFLDMTEAGNARRIGSKI
jgi:hypothetical protein